MGLFRGALLSSFTFLFLAQGEVGAQSYRYHYGSDDKTIYCCEVNNRPVCGDTLPPACYGRAYREMSPQGLVRRHVQEALSDEEFSRRAEQERLKKIAESEQAKQRRLSQVVRDTYNSLDDLEARRSRELNDVDQQLTQLRAHEKELLEQKKKTSADLALNKGNINAEQVLTNEMASLNAQLVDQKALIEMKMAERVAINRKFDEDRRHYTALNVSAEKQP